MVNNRITDCHASPVPAEVTTTHMGNDNMNQQQDRIQRTIGLDCHPDSFTAVVMVGSLPMEAKVERLTEAINLDQLEQWFTKHPCGDETVVLEASANSFELYSRLTALGFSVLVLNSEQVGRISKTYCDNDKIAAVRIAAFILADYPITCGYLTG